MTKQLPPLQKQRLMALTTHAITLAKISIRLGWLAVAVFLVFGTLASLPAFKDSALIYWAFYYLPHLLVGLSIPISLYHLFILSRYRIIQLGILKMLMAVGFGLLLFALLMGLQQHSVAFSMSLFLAMVVWFGMPYLFLVNFKKYLSFLQN